MTAPLVGVGPARTALVTDGDYPAAAIAMVHASRSRCLASVFIVDVLPAEPWPLLDLVEALSDAAWRGVDCRVVIGGSREAYQIARSAVSGRAILAESGVPVRWLTGTPVTGSHAKFLVADDLSLLGSHNWSPGSFSGGQVQESLLIDSGGFAGVLHQMFEQQWARAGGES